mmetsp:Transcript_148082/g.258819  ORF Transcript_148082/g.258819 Transcript_148082/m.258819 type:complete len:315 (-) Transcript_148082:775-1719(-)
MFGIQEEPIFPQVAGNAKVFCGGACVVGPHWKTAIVSIGLIVVPVVLFNVYVAPSGLVTIVSILLAILCIIFLIITALTDPGIIPKGNLQGEQLKGFPNEVEEIVNGVKVKRRWCQTCQILRPLRASHCPYCDNCVKRYDHHCPWTGTCIGERNYRFYVAFVYVTTVLSVFVAVFCALNLKSAYKRFAKAHGTDDRQSKALLDAFASTYFMGPFLLTFCAAMVCSIGGLASFHTFLCCTGQTTREDLRRIDNNKNPYDRGSLANVLYTCCSTIPASMLQAQYTQPEDMQELRDCTQIESQDTIGDATLDGYPED